MAALLAPQVLAVLISELTPVSIATVQGLVKHLHNLEHPTSTVKANPIPVPLPAPKD
jgi:hypothetical protein